MTAEQERDALAEAIVAAGVKAGIVNNDAPLTGPHLIMICDDLAGIAEAAELRGAERMRERAVWREAIALIVGLPVEHYLFSGRHPMHASIFRNNAVKALEAAMTVRTRSESTGE